MRVPNFGENRAAFARNGKCCRPLRTVEVRLARGGRGERGNRSKPTGKLAGTRDLGGWEKITVVLELKSVADVGLVGFQTQARAHYFAPSANAAQGRIRVHHHHPARRGDDGRGISSITVADITGLIEGAHMNRGWDAFSDISAVRAFIFVVDLRQDSKHRDATVGSARGVKGRARCASSGVV